MPDDYPSLDEAYQLALQAKAAGRMRFTISIRPPERTSRLVRMWGSCVGDVIHKQWARDEEGGWYAERITLQLSVIDVTEAYRRRAIKIEKDVASPLRVNRIAPVQQVSTTR